MSPSLDVAGLQLARQRRLLKPEENNSTGAPWNYADKRPEAHILKLVRELDVANSALLKRSPELV